MYLNGIYIRALEVLLFSHPQIFSPFTNHFPNPKKKKMISSKKLIRMARKWQRLAVASRKRISLPRSISTKRAQEVDKGHFVAYTTDEKRFVLPLAYLESEIVRELLRMAEEEFGFTGDGPITLPCDSVFLDYAISMTQKSVTRELEEAVLLSLSHGHSSSSASIIYDQIPICCC